MFINDTSQEGGTIFCSVPLYSCRREIYSLSESMGKNYHGLVGSVSYSGGTSSSVSEVISTVRDSHLFVSYIRQREADSSVGGSSVFDLERSNREGSGSFSIARFLLPSGGMRPVIDLSILNTFLLVPHFKMETNRSIRSCIHPGMWTTNLDLMDAYFHIPIAPPFRKFLRFDWDNTVYQFRTLPFGNTTALIVFTSVLQTVIAHLHTLSIQIHSYLDDSLIKDFDQQTLVSQTEMVIQLFLNLFFLYLGRSRS